MTVCNPSSVLSKAYFQSRSNHPPYVSRTSLLVLILQLLQQLSFSRFALTSMIFRSGVEAFETSPIPLMSNTKNTRTMSRIKTELGMGLYDKPLPSRAQGDGNDNKDTPKIEDDDKDSLDSLSPEQKQPIFSFTEDGKEKRNLLPPLKRTLETGIGCYFEPTDRLVQNLAEKVDCHPSDAAWALEVCQGDVTEAWVQISTARRRILEEKEDDITDAGNKRSLSKQVSDLMVENDFEILKQERLEQEKKMKRKSKAGNDLFQPGTPDQEWLPRKNLGPLDDEPWFTG